MSLNDYLAKHYGSVSENKDTKKQKKKSHKHKHTDHHHHHQQQQQQPAQGSSSGIKVVLEDDDFPFTPIPDYQQNPDNQSRAISKSKHKSQFKSTDSTWHTVHLTNPLNLQNEKEEEEVVAEDEQPVIQHITSDHPEATPEDSRPTMHYGLQTAEIIKRDSDLQHARYLRKLQESTDDQSGRTAQTIYRDKHGQKINIEDARKSEQERLKIKEEARRNQAEWNKGLVQQREKANRSRAMEVAGDQSELLNRERREKMRWDDPALRFLENKPAVRKEYPEYKGYAPPNRFGIKPGYRWDGVDR
ncbi:Pre-mRNA-splicing factor cwc26, partial [Kickxella alabastrina]